MQEKWKGPGPVGLSLDSQLHLATIVQRTSRKLHFEDGTETAKRAFDLLTKLEEGFRVGQDLSPVFDSIDRNLVQNLSSFRLTHSALSVLRKGVQFVPSLPRSALQLRDRMHSACALFVDTLSSRLSWFEGAHQLRSRAAERSSEDVVRYQFLSYFYRKTHDVYVNDDHISLNDLSFLHVFKRHLATAVDNADCSFVANLSARERLALLDLRRRTTTRQIAIRKADKGRQIVVCDYRDYVSSVEDFLSDKTSYVLACSFQRTPTDRCLN